MDVHELASTVVAGPVEEMHPVVAALILVGLFAVTFALMGGFMYAILAPLEGLDRPSLPVLRRRRQAALRELGVDRALALDRRYRGYLRSKDVAFLATLPDLGHWGLEDLREHRLFDVAGVRSSLTRGTVPVGVLRRFAHDDALPADVQVEAALRLAMMDAMELGAV
jgi:hypothetical protein